MRKRKEHDAPSRTIPIGILALALGLLLLSGFSVFGVWQLANIPPTYTPLPVPALEIFPTVPPRPYPTYTPLPTLPPVQPKSPPPVLPGSGHIAYSTKTRNDIAFYSSEGQRVSVLTGNDVALSPDERILAYVRDGRLYLRDNVFWRYYDDRTEIPVAIPGEAKMPAWNGEGTALAIVLQTRENNAVYQVPMETMQPIRVWATPNTIVAPPQPVPGRKRWLIAELVQPGKTMFYTIGSTCGSFDVCLSTRQEIGMVPFTVTWADYHPSGTIIGFTELQKGDLYQLATANGEVKLMADDKTYKRRIAFSPDGTSLVYVSRSNELFMMLLEKPLSVQWLLPTDVASVDWAGK